MPLSALIGPGAGLVGGFLNQQAQNQQNFQSQIFSQGMYERQYADAIKFWEMQNEYNSPAAQMKRFQEAGLNPNLIYGQGNSGNAGSVQMPDVQRPEFRPASMGDAVSMAGLTYMNSMYDLDIKKAQHDNLMEQNTVIQNEAMLKAAQTLATLTGEEKTRFQLTFDKMMADVSAEYRKEQVRKLKADIDYTTDENARKAVMNASNVLEAKERMASMLIQRAHTRADINRIKAITSNTALDSELKNLELELKRQGIYPHDPMWARAIAKTLDAWFNVQDLKDLPKSFMPYGSWKR